MQAAKLGHDWWQQTGTASSLCGKFSLASSRVPSPLGPFYNSKINKLARIVAEICHTGYTAMFDIGYASVCFIAYGKGAPKTAGSVCGVDGAEQHYIRDEAFNFQQSALSTPSV